MENNEEQLLKEAQEKFDSRKYFDAYQLYQELADKGNVMAMLRCGYMCKNGTGTKKNLSDAYRYWTSAIDAGNDDAGEELMALRRLVPFNDNGTIDITKKKRSAWTTSFIVLVLISSLFNVLMPFFVDEKAQIELQPQEQFVSFLTSNAIVAGVMFLCTLSLLLWKKIGGYILLAFIFLAFLSFGFVFVLPTAYISCLISIITYGFISLFLFLLLQIKKNGVPSWNVLMKRPYVGRNVLTELIDSITAYGTGECFKADSRETRNWKQIGTTIAVFVGLGAIACGVAIIIAGRFDFNINWNFFNSVLAFPLYFIGLIISLFFMKALTYKYQYRWTDPHMGKKKAKDSDDMMDVMEGQIIMPLLSKFIIYPLLIACAIYYALMGIFYLLEAILPYVIAVLLIASIVFCYSCIRRTLDKEFRRVLIPVTGVLFLFGYFLIYMVWSSNIKEEDKVLPLPVDTSVIVPADTVVPIPEEVGETDDDLSSSQEGIQFGTRYTFEGTLTNGKAVILELEGTGGNDLNVSGTFCYAEKSSEPVDIMGVDDANGISVSSIEGDAPVLISIKGIYMGKAFKGTLTEGDLSQDIVLKQIKVEQLLD